MWPMGLLYIFIFFSRTTELISTKLGTKYPWVKVIQVCSNEEPHPFHRGDNYEIVNNTLIKLKNLLLQNHWANFNQTWHKVSLGEWHAILFKEEAFIIIKIIFFFSSLNQRYVSIDFNCFVRWAMWPMGLLLYFWSFCLENKTRGPKTRILKYIFVNFSIDWVNFVNERTLHLKKKKYRKS